MFSPIIRSTWPYLQYLVVFTQVAAGWCREWVEIARNISPELKFSVELEYSNNINILDDHLHERSQFYIDFYISKTNCTIPRYCSHSSEHKEAGIRYFINRINTYTNTYTRYKNKVILLIQDIVYNNNQFHSEVFNTLQKKLQVNTKTITRGRKYGWPSLV
jgi:hypothetical protein